MTTPAFGRYEEAFEAIYFALMDIMAPPLKKQITKLEFTYDVDKDIQTIVAKQNAETLFTLTFAYNIEKDISSITRS